MKRKIILVFKTHFDYGFTDLAENVLQQYTGAMLRDVVAACVDTASLDSLRFVFTLPAWALQVMLDSGNQRDTLEQLVKEGQVAWHALPYTTHTDFAAVEDTIESFKYARHLSAEFGKPLAISAKLTDVPGHGRILPTLLAGAGVRFLHLGCNEYAMPPDLPELFFWEGPDGSRVLTMYCKDGYGSSELIPEGWPYPVSLAMMHTHDNNGPQSPDEIRALVEKARRDCPDTEIVSGTLDDFYTELARCDLSSLPVIRQDLADSWIHGIGSYPVEVAALRRTRQELLAAQKAAALAGAAPAGFCDAIGKAYDEIILFDEHTWGLDVKTWMNHARVYDKAAFTQQRGSEEYRRMERSWDEQRLRATGAAKQVAEAMALLPKGNAAVVLNPGGAAYSGWAALQDDDLPLPANAAETVFFGSRQLWVQDAPALAATPAGDVAAPAAGAAAYHSEGGAGIFENHRYRLRLNESTGAVEEVVDKTLGAPVLAAKDPQGAVYYQYDVYSRDDVEQFLNDFCYIDSDWGVLDNGRTNYPPVARQSATPRYTGFAVEGDTLILRYAGCLTEEYGDANGVELHITLPPAGEELFVELKLQGKQATPYIESGSLVFSLPDGQTHYRLNKNGDLIDPAADIARGANHVLYCLEAFAAAYGKQAGLCVVTHDTPLVAIGETGIYTYRQEYEEHTAEFVFNLFNNMWGTNFPQWMEGDYRFCYTLFGAAPQENITQRGLALYEGVRVGRWPAAQGLFRLPPQVHVSACKPLDGGCLLRLRDTGGTARTVEVEAADPKATLRLLDLQQNPIGPKAMGRLSAPLAPYGILTLWAGPATAE